jgi:hypothetical protein
MCTAADIFLALNTPLTLSTWGGVVAERHIHADCIIAWANGAKIQCRVYEDEGWIDVMAPNWSHSYEYRVKPIPKPDIVKYSPDFGPGWPELYPAKESDKKNNGFGVIKKTYDGETGKLKSVEIVE